MVSILAVFQPLYKFGHQALILGTMGSPKRKITPSWEHICPMQSCYDQPSTASKLLKWHSIPRKLTHLSPLSYPYRLITTHLKNNRNVSAKRAIQMNSRVARQPGRFTKICFRYMNSTSVKTVYFIAVAVAYEWRNTHLTFNNNQV